MNTLPQSPENQNNSPKRPMLLTVLCILSFIGSGMSSFSFLMVYSSYNEVMPMLKELGENFPGMELFFSAGKNFFLTGFVLYFISLIGVSLMWRMKKAGLHFYIGAQVMILLLPVLYIDDYPFPFLDALITGVFIFLYSRFYKIFS